jgi:hypothetical protein
MWRKNVLPYPQLRAHLQFDRIPLFISTDQHHQMHLVTYCLPYIRLQRTSNHYIFTLKIATSVFAEALDYFLHSTRLIPESRSCALYPSSEVFRLSYRTFSYYLSRLYALVSRFAWASYSIAIRNANSWNMVEWRWSRYMKNVICDSCILMDLLYATYTSDPPDANTELGYLYSELKFL